MVDLAGNLEPLLSLSLSLFSARNESLHHHPLNRATCDRPASLGSCAHMVGMTVLSFFVVIYGFDLTRRGSICYLQVSLPECLMKLIQFSNAVLPRRR